MREILTMPFLQLFSCRTEPKTTTCGFGIIPITGTPTVSVLRYLTNPVFHHLSQIQIHHLRLLLTEKPLLTGTHIITSTCLVFIRKLRLLPIRVKPLTLSVMNILTDWCLEHRNTGPHSTTSPADISVKVEHVFSTNRRYGTFIQRKNKHS